MIENYIRIFCSKQCLQNMFFLFDIFIENQFIDKLHTQATNILQSISIGLSF